MALQQRLISDRMWLALAFVLVHTVLVAVELKIDAHYMDDALAAWERSDRGSLIPIVPFVLDFPIRALYTAFGLVECAGSGGPSTWCAVRQTSPILLSYFALGGVLYGAVGYAVVLLIERGSVLLRRKAGE